MCRFYRDLGGIQPLRSLPEASSWGHDDSGICWRKLVTYRRRKVAASATTQFEFKGGLRAAFTLFGGLLNSEIAHPAARLQLLCQPAWLLATTRPGLRRIGRIFKFREDGWVRSASGRTRLLISR